MTSDLADALRNDGASRVLTPDEPDYATELRTFNLAIRMSPDVVVAATTAKDVEIAIAAAQRTGSTIAAVGLGHGFAHDIDGGIAVTTRGLAGVHVNVAERTARVGAGTPWSTVLEAATPHGLAALCGSAPGVGVTGYTLGGGIGPISRTFGFTADYVAEIEVVTPADGILTVSETAHPDLFWALRGGKGGLGIVTSITIDLLPIGDVYGGGLYFAADSAREVVAAFGTWCTALPETVTTSVALLRLPPVAELPEPIRGRFVAHLRFAALEEPAAAERMLAPMRAIVTPLLDTIGVLPFARIGEIHSDPVQPTPATEGGVTLASFGPDAVAALFTAAGPDVDVPLAAVEVRALGGALAREARVPNAVGGRDAAFLLHVVSAPIPELLDTVLRETVGAVLAALDPWRAPTLLINFIGRSNAPGAGAQSWTSEQNARLDAVRAAADPSGLFPIAGHG